MGHLESCSDFHELTAESIRVLNPFYNTVTYEACEYNFITMFMWQQVYDFKYAIKNDIAVLFGEYEDEVFATAPICPKHNLDKGFDFIEELFAKLNRPIILKAITEPVKKFILERYKDRFEMSFDRDSSDYIYEGEKLRTLSGRKMHSKKNHYNGFMKEYGNRYSYRTLTKEDFPRCIQITDKWAYSKEKDQNLIGERLAIQKVFKNYNQFPQLKIGGIYIDNVLEAFAIGDYIHENMAVIHIEKGNPAIRGLYAAINKIFLENEFPEVELVNREEDLGLEGLREAKLSYKPVYLVDKFSFKEL